jgi:RNA polymerase sigma-70 factor (ECF subfamily)
MTMAGCDPIDDACALRGLPSTDQPDDADRFTELFRQCLSPIHDFARRRVGTDAAQEIVAETFLVAWRRLDDIPDQALPWLYVVASNQVANLQRGQRSTNRLHQALRVVSASSTTGDNPDSSTELAHAVGQAFDALRPRDQEILRLAAWEQLTSVEGAAVLGCSVSAYRVRLHRARARLARKVNFRSRPNHDPTESTGTPT